jgi:flap endonuclease-1
MGIKGLFQLLKSEAPDSYKETDKTKYNGKVIAIDASILLYQFLVQIRTKGEYGSQLLVNDDGEVTSHIQGFFNRTANLLENGIKPVFVFDGKPPELKYAELSKRKETKKKAAKELEEATERAEKLREEGSGSENEKELESAIEDMDKAAKRNIHISKQQFDDVKTLLRLMGVPVVEAPSEAEAQCAELVKGGKVFATGTEDMDALTLGTPVILRKLTMPESSKEKVVEITLSKVLSGLDLTYEQFIDLCILCGCDYCQPIKGVGPKTALKMIRKHGDIETIIENLPERYTVPESLENNLEKVRDLFRNPDVRPANEIDFVFGKPNREEIVEFLVSQKGFNKDRVNKVLDKIGGKSKIKVDEKQPTIESFFKIKKKPGNV